MPQAAGQQWRNRLLKFCACCGGDRPLAGQASVIATASVGSGSVPSLWSGSAQPDERLVEALVQALRRRPHGGREGSYFHELRRSQPELNSLSEVQVTWLGANDSERRFSVQTSVSGILVSLTAAALRDVETTAASHFQSSATDAIDTAEGLAQPSLNGCKDSVVSYQVQVEDEDTEFIQRIMTLQREMDKNRRGPMYSEKVLPQFPVYGQGSPLWDRTLANDSGDSDPEMPALVPFRTRGICSATSPPGRENSYGALSGSTDGFDEGTPPITPSSEKKGGFGACWGRDALRGALKSMDVDENSPQPRASGDIGPTPL